MNVKEARELIEKSFAFKKGVGFIETSDAPYSHKDPWLLLGTKESAFAFLPGSYNEEQLIEHITSRLIHLYDHFDIIDKEALKKTRTTLNP